MTVTLMATSHRIVFGDCKSMREIRDDSVHLMVTSPPYYNAPFDYPGLFKDYDEFLGLMREVSCELYRVLAPGRVACFVTDDMLVDGVKYPVVADVTRLMMEEGIAAFPEEIPRRLLKLYSFAGETVLDPFAGSGTTLRVAKELGRNSWGFEVDLELKDTIRRKLETTNGNGKITFQQRKDARKLRSLIRESVKRRKSVALTHMA